MEKPSAPKSLKINNITTTLILLIFILGSLLTWYTIVQVESEMKSGLLGKARIAAQSINKTRLEKLSGTPADSSNHNYQRIKTQLIKMREAYPHCKFLYLMGKNKKGEIFFYVDSQHPNSEDYAAPGLVYNEVSKEYLEAFNSLKEKTAGPVEDRWGELMTALIPIKNEETGALIAMLGMDVTIKHWMGEIIKRTGPIVVLVLVSIVLVFYIQQFRFIKKQKEAEVQIKKSKEQYQALFEQAADGILIGNEKGIIIDANESMCQMSGYSKEEMVGKKINFLFNKQEIDIKPFEYESVLAGKTITNERSLLKKDGTPIFIEMNTKKVGDGRLQAFFRNITERKKKEQLIKQKNEELITTEEELRSSNEELQEKNDMLARQKEILEQTKKKAEESDKLKTIFLANMSHEIRTPMNGIIGFSELLTEESFSENERKDYLQTIHSLSLNLLQIIDDIIDISKIEANQLTISKENFYLNDIIDELDMISQMRIKQKGNNTVTIKSHKPLPKKDSQIYSDLTRLKQIFNNLLGNALKFTNKGEIEFGYKQQSMDEWLFFVKDTGIGIPQNKKQKIFERFRQIEESYKGQFEGTGLGLSIAKSIVTKLGGNIWVESEYGKGSKFYFTIPKK
mgnify:CR=1 FL=1